MYYLPPIVVLLLIAVTWANQRVKRAAQPLRLKLAEQGEALLGDPNLPENLTTFVRYLLDTAFGNRATLIGGLFYVPIIAGWIALRPWSISTMSNRFRIRNKDTRARFDDLMRLHDRITFANNPILLMLLEFEILVFVPAAILLNGIARQWFPDQPDRDTMMSVIEEKSAAIYLKHRKAA